MGEITFEIKKPLGVIAEEGAGWRRELNLVSWNEEPAKVDLRSWSPDHRHLSRGITLTTEEARMLMELLMKEFKVEEKEKNHEC